MGIYSIGVDVAEVDRIQALIERYGDRFLQRVFTANEIDYCGPKASAADNYAARFATKEAVFKATGLGLNRGMHWRDIEVRNDEHGKPSVRLSGVTAKIFEGKRVHLSLSHAGNIAIAMVVVEDAV